MNNQELPELYKPVLAKIERFNPIKPVIYYDVIHRNSESWGVGNGVNLPEYDTVLEWRYCHELFN